MAGWTVEVVADSSEMPLALREPVAEGGTTCATLVTLDGRDTTLIVCPRCGMAGHCAEHDSDLDHGGRLTVRPSILCSCGGHFWLTAGALTEA